MCISMRLYHFFLRYQMCGIRFKVDIYTDKRNKNVKSIRILKKKRNNFGDHEEEGRFGKNIYVYLT